MSILYDARGNEIRSAFPDSVTNESTTDPRPITAVLASLNALVSIDLNGAVTVTFDVRNAAAISMTLAIEGTIDGTNYFPVAAMARSSTIAGVFISEQMVQSPVITTNPMVISYAVPCAGYRNVRLIISNYVSGSITVAARASSAPFMLYARPMPVILWVTVTAAANTLATCTLPAPGNGLHIYIVYLNCRRNATAALAGTATLIITTTGLTGAPAWSNGNAMIAGGTVEDVNYQASVPIKSTTANNPVTIIMPAAGAAVLNRINCGYYVGAA